LCHGKNSKTQARHLPAAARHEDANRPDKP
jgi:hypothetical protein